MSVPLVIVVAAAFLLAGLVAWVFAVERFYRVRAAPAEPERVTTEDGWSLSVLHRRAGRRYLEPVVLCHGLSTSARNFDFEPPWSLAHFLAD